MQYSLSQMVSRWTISSLSCMVRYASRWLKVSWFNVEIKWTFVSTSAMPKSQVHHLNCQANYFVAIPTCHIMAMPKHKLNLLH